MSRHGLRFCTGNVVRNKRSKDLYVVYVGYDDKYTLIPFDATNCTSHPQEKKTFRNEMCGCYVDQRCPDPDCKECRGTGQVTRQNMWAGDYTLAAETIQKLFEDGLKRKFKL